jgi:hypothetical protein
MSYKTRAPLRLWPFAVALALPAAASAWQAQPAAPAPVIILQPPANARFQQTVREHQVRDQLQKNQVEEQLRQGRADAMRRPYAASAVHAGRLDQTDRTQQELYRARQQDLMDRYQSAVAPPVVHPGKAPASSRSGD